MLIYSFAAIYPIFFALSFAQVKKVTDSQNFSENMVALSFLGEHIREGSVANHLFSRLGVRFSAADHSELPVSIREHGIPDSPNPFLGDFPVIRNEASGPLIIDFSHPIRRAGFFLSTEAGNNDEVEVELAAFGRRGQLLGSLEHEGLPGGIAPPVLLGIEVEEEVDATEWISKITISTWENGSDGTEEVEGILVDFVSPPEFTSFFPQVAAGVISPGGSFLQTLLSFTNPSGMEGNVQLTFFDGEGEPSDFLVDGTPAEEIDFILPPRASKSILISGTDDPAVSGYARIESSVPLASTASFRVVDQEALVSETGVGSARSGFTATAPVTQSAEEGIDTAIALVNCSEKDSDVSIQPISEAGEGIVVPFHVELPGRERRALFLSELFPEIFSGDTNGSISIRSTTRLAITVLRTRYGLPVKRGNHGPTCQVCFGIDQL